MKTAALTFPEIAAIAGTRAILGAGIGLLCSDYLDRDQRKSLGWALVGFGAATTVPLATDVFLKMGAPRNEVRQRDSRTKPRQSRGGRRAPTAEA